MGALFIARPRSVSIVNSEMMTHPQYTQVYIQTNSILLDNENTLFLLDNEIMNSNCNITVKFRL